MRSLKALFVQLGFNQEYPDVSTRATTYNDGLYYVASFLEREVPLDHVDVCQMFWGQDPADFPLASYDYIFVSALATHFWSNLEAMRVIARGRRADSILVMGGPHATFAPYEALEYADYVVLGEGEMPALQLVSHLEAGEDVSGVENLCYRGDSGELVMNSFTRYKSLDNAINPRLLAGAPRLHWATVSLSRGCPFDCSFCYAIRILGRQFRPKKVGTILEELDGLYDQTGCSRFYVTDLNFTTRNDFCSDVARAVRGRPYHFIAMSRVDFAANTELLLELKKSGFKEYCLGVESEDAAVLDTFNKKVDASAQTEWLHTYAENDIYIHSAIIFGLESQDEEAIRKTAAWCARARIMHPTFVCLAEYPFQNLLFGSRQDIEDHRIIMEVPTYQHYSFVGIFPRHMRPSALQRAIIDSYDVFFEHAFEIEQRPQRRMRLKSYAKSVELGRAGMYKHIEFLKQLEKPYYTSAGTLREDLLKADFEGKYGALRDTLGRTVRKGESFLKAFAS